MKRNHLILTSLVLAMTFVIAGIWFQTFQKDEHEAISDADLLTLTEEEIPLSVPENPRLEFKSGYEMIWSTDPLVDAGLYIGTIGVEQVAKLQMIGNKELTTLTGLTREAAEKIVGKPITTYNNVQISALNGPTKAYYRLNSEIYILYYDAATKPSKVLFVFNPKGSLITSTRFFSAAQTELDALGDQEAMTLALINGIRAAYGKSALTANDPVAVVSKSHSQAMVSGNYFSHTNLAGQGPKERLKAANIPFSNYGEVLSAGTYTPMDAITLWMNSPGHRDILLGEYQSAGIGIATGNTPYGIYYTINFIKER